MDRTLVFLAFFLMFLGIAFILMPFLALPKDISGAFVITIFFIPIAGSFGKYGDILLILLLILSIALVLLNFLFLRRGKESEG